MTDETRTVNLAQSQEWASDLSGKFSDRQIVLLTGGLGAGKTQWVQFFLQSLKVKPSASPTYSLIHEVQGHENRKIFHVDLYRLEGAADVESVGFWDLFDEKRAVVFIEWPERIDFKDLPMDWSIMTLKIDPALEPDFRSVTVSISSEGQLA